MNLLPCIMAGGAGQRLWPLSRPKHPKQFLDIGDNKESMLQCTIKRAVKLGGAMPLVVGNLAHKSLIISQFATIDAECSLILEPTAKNTLATAIISALEAKARNIEHVLLMPSDHKIDNTKEFIKKVTTGLRYLIKKQEIVMFGISPESPSEEYGYVRTQQSDQEISRVIQFIEKPHTERAREHFASKHFLWNVGIFLYTTDFMLSETQRLDPDLYSNAVLAYHNARIHNSHKTLDAKHFSKIVPISIDHGLAEKTEKAIIIKCDNIGWADLGSIRSIHCHTKRKQDDNASIGNNCHLFNTNNSLVINNSDMPVVIKNIDDVVVVACPDVLFVSGTKEQKSNTAQALKTKTVLQPSLKNRFRREPWGMSYVLFEHPGTIMLKKSILGPRKNVNIKTNKTKDTTLAIVLGRGILTTGKHADQQELLKNQTIALEPGKLYSIKNHSTRHNLTFVEIQQTNNQNVTKRPNR